MNAVLLGALGHLDAAHGMILEESEDLTDDHPLVVIRYRLAVLARDLEEHIMASSRRRARVAGCLETRDIRL
jgi:hypothetical protein